MTYTSRLVKGLTVLALLILTMLAMQALQARVVGDVSLAVTFAAIGFVVMAAYALAELAALFGLPRVTGYILAGIGLGPSAGAMMGLSPPILGHDVVLDMGVFNSLALALIALEAGLELSLESLKRFKKTLGSIILFKIPLAWIMVGGLFVLLASTVLPIGITDINELIAIGLVLGALSVGTSPAVSIAVISETASKGKTPDLVLGFAVFKDVVMVLMVAVAVAIGNVLITDDPFDAAILVKLVQKVGVSLIFGAMLGGVLIAWMRWVRWELILILLLVAYGVNTFEAYLHDVHSPLQFKPLLTFIAAGFVVSNFSKHGHALHRPLELLALPVFVIFFTVAGAKLDLESAIAILPLAGALFLVRALMMYVSTRFGGKLAGESKPYTNILWMGFISQAGVALVLLGIAQDAMDPLSDPLGRVAFALIALNLLIGPVMLRIALKRGADAETADRVAERGAATTPAEAPAMPLVAAEMVPAPLPDDEPLRVAYEEVDRRVKFLLDALDADLISPWAASAKAALAVGEPQALLVPATMTPIALELRQHVRLFRDGLIELPVIVSVPLRTEHLSTDHDLSFIGKAQAMLLRLRLKLGPARRAVRVRSLVRRSVEGRLVTELAYLLDEVALAEAKRIDLIDRLNREGRGVERDIEAENSVVSEEITNSADALRAHLQRLYHEVSHDLSFKLRFASTPVVPRSATRFSSVAGEIDRSLKRLDSDGVAWDNALSRIANRASLREKLLASEREILRVSAGALDAWSELQSDILLALVVSVREALDDAQKALDIDPAKIEPDKALEAVERQIIMLGDLLNDEVLPQSHQFRLATENAGPLSRLEGEVSAYVPEVSETLSIAPTSLDLSLVKRPDDVVGFKAPVAETVEKYLIGEIAWSVAETRAQDEEVVARVEQRLAEIAGGATVGLRAGIDEMHTRYEDQTALSESVVYHAQETIERARRISSALFDNLTVELESVPDNIREATDDAFVRVFQRLLGEPDTSEAAVGQRRETLRRAAGSFATKAKHGWRGVGGGVRRFYRRLVGSELAQRARLRSGTDHADPSRMARDIFALEPSKQTIERLPYVLARLFSPSSLDTHHLLTGVEDQVDALKAAHARFELGIPTSVVVRGAAGSGKTSMARVTLRGLMGRRLADVVLDAEHRSEAALCEALGTHGAAFEARTFRALEHALRQEGGAILLDGAEQLFTRSAENLRLIRGLLGLIAATRSEVLWVVSIDEPTALLLERLCDFLAYFTDHIDLAPLDPETLGNLLEVRCRLSGFEIDWPKVPGDQRNLWRRITKRRQTRQEQRERFLAALARASGGNIRDALTYFVNAIGRVEPEVIRLGPVPTPALSWFDQLGRDAHRLLALHVLCGPLSFSEAQSSFLWTTERLDAAKARLLGAGLLVGDRHDGERLHLRPHAWRPVTAALVARNELLGA